MGALTGAEAKPGSSLQRTFQEAAGEFRVPDAVLLSLSYHLTLWEDHNGRPSTSGGYGPMHLTDVPGTRDPAAHTLLAAASLLHQPAHVLIHDPVENIRGGAALLAHFGAQTGARGPADMGSWYGAVARYSGSNTPAAMEFASRVFRTIRTGASRLTSHGELVQLSPKMVTPETRTALSLHLRSLATPKSECPSDLVCRYIPAAYQVVNPQNPEDYGNYDVAKRPKDGLAIRYIVIHDTEGSYDSAISSFQNPSRYGSANYVVRSSDGLVTQMVRTKNIAWHAGNYYVNMHSIGIEHEGVAIQGATWYSENLYESSASLVSYLADRFNIPLDRAHIFGHDEAPGPSPSEQTAQHWDPGPFWDWQHYMNLLGAALPSTGSTSTPAIGSVVTVNPDFSGNQPPVTYCASAGGCSRLAAQSANFVYLRTAPSSTAPLLSDRALRASGAGTTQANDWGDKAVTGAQYVVVDCSGDWVAIDYGGQKAWLDNPPDAPVLAPADSQILTPRTGLTSIPVYGAAYPGASAYPKSIHHPEKIVPLQYTIPAGQQYVAVERVTSDFYWSPTQTRHTIVNGKTHYYQIFFNHRFAFVRDRDVAVQPPAAPQ